MKKITVLGSINMDLVTSASRAPKPGETVLGDSFHTIPGGKGANQAVAAARLGAEVKMAGCVGDDSFGKDLLHHLRQEAVDVSNVKIEPGKSTGIASIILEERENRIIVVPGANYEVTPEFVQGLEEVVASSDFLLLQLEIPMESVMLAAALAKKHGGKVILNPAPFQLLSKELIENIDYLTPNEHEYQLLLSSSITEEEKGEYMKKCIITKGGKGVSIHADAHLDIPGWTVNVVDTTGAGDTFNGALAYAFCTGMELADACRFANAAAALSVTKLGAQGGMPAREEVEAFLITNGVN